MISKEFLIKGHVYEGFLRIGKTQYRARCKWDGELFSEIVVLDVMAIPVKTASHWKDYAPGAVFEPQFREGSV